MRLDEDCLVAGIVVRDFNGGTQASKKMRRRLPNGPTVQEVTDVIAAYERIDQDEIDEIRRRQDAVIDEFRRSEGYKEELLELLRPQLEQMLAQIHDYRQFVAQVVQNVNVILERRAPGKSTDEKLEAALHEEAAIYWAARLMEEKLNTAVFLLNPSRIDDPKTYVAFRLHGLVIKYTRIYQRSFDQKGLRIQFAGESYGNVIGNPEAIGVIPHTFLDNALKYAPRGSRVEITFEEAEDDIFFSVGSLGPLIEPDERDRIFELFQRGRHASRQVPEGTGFGLHLAQLIASKIGTTIEVQQDSKEERSGCFWTEFSVRLPRA